MRYRKNMNLKTETVPFRWSCIRVHLCLFVLLVLAACKSSPNYYKGRVHDESGSPLKDVQVSENSAGQQSFTDSKGYFRMIKREGSLSNLIFSKKGFKTDTIPSVCHHAGKATTYNFINDDTTPVTLHPLNIKPKALSVRREPGSTVGTVITGDFQGDGQSVEAIQVLIKKGEGNPVENGVPDDYAVQFPGSQLPEIKVGCCDFRLINEGNLDGYPGDEFSIFQSPMNGCTYTMHTYAFKDGNWKELIPAFMVPTGCEVFSDDQLQQRIFLDGGKLYYYRTDANDENFRLLKTLVELK